MSGTFEVVYLAQEILMSANTAALIAVCVLGAIVAWDAFWLTRQRQDIPHLGELPNGGFAWTSENRVLKSQVGKSKCRIFEQQCKRCRRLLGSQK